MSQRRRHRGKDAIKAIAGAVALLAETLALGWRPLSEVPDRAIVVGAVTLEAAPLGPAASRFRTETRVSTTDPRSRALFRRYWAFVSPGILLIRRESLNLVKAEAERRFRPPSHTI